MASDIAYIKSINHSVNMADGLFGAQPASPAPPKQPFKVRTTNDLVNQFNSSPLLFWGEDNKYPFKLEDAAKKVGVLQQGLNRLVKYAYNQGIFYYQELDAPDNNGVQKVKILNIDKIESFLRYSRIHSFLINSFRNYFKMGINFPVYLLDENRKVSQLRTYEARECRLQRPHPVTGNIENVYVSQFWKDGIMLGGEDVPADQHGLILKYPLLDDFNIEDQILYHDQAFTFVQRIRNAMFAADDYGGAEWHSVYFNKWLNISADVAELKARLFTYAMTLNYIIYIDDAYWKTIFVDEWDGWNSEQKAEKVKELQQTIERDLSGKNNAFKTLLASIRYNMEGKPEKSLIVETIDNKMRESTTLIPDNLHANGEILAALGVDACLLGATVLGDKISSGSGSNIREAALNLIALLCADRHLCLEPLRVTQKINGWDPNIKWGFKDYIIGTQDGRPPVKGNENTPA